VATPKYANILENASGKNPANCIKEGAKFKRDVIMKRIVAIEEYLRYKIDYQILKRE
jgi:hypothetical protein